MSIQDITKEQFNTLVLIRSLEEFAKDNHENFSKLSEAVKAFMEGLLVEEHRQIVSDICKLTETGYLLSDATEEDIELCTIPEVEGITPKGQSALNQWEEEIKESMAGKEKGTTEIHVNFNWNGDLTFSPSLISTQNGLFGALGSIAGNMIKEMLKK